jgi:parallel beta-helix repeat protein
MLSRSLSVLALTLTALSALGGNVALGQNLSPFGTASEQPGESTTPQGYTLIHVHGVGGSDTIGDGTQLRPYQTIAHALEVATPGSIIMLAPGEYTEASGETFPLRLQPGITVQGSPSPGSHQTVIRGSGIYQSTTEGYMQATVVGVDGAGLGHVTVTNPASNGYGLVVEAGSPVVRGNAFVGSGYGGAYIAGPGTPVIENNLFRQNGVVGLVIANQSTAQVQGNVFEDTGTGIRVVPGAQPHISNNRVVQNQQGIVLAADARPVLANNEIARNRQNGLVELVATAKVDGSHPPTALFGQGTATASPFAADPIAPLSPPAHHHRSTLSGPAPHHYRSP